MRRLSWDGLHALVSRLQQLFVSLGVKKGDRVAAMMPNMPEAVAGMLAAASLGAVWSSCSPDFGEQGVLDRFGQIEPVLFLAPDGYWYNGKQNDVTAKVQAVLAKLPIRSPGDPRRLSRHGAAGGHRHAQGGRARRRACAIRGEGGRVRAPALLPPALHPLLVGHDRHPEMHRPFRRRHAAAALEGAAASRRRDGRRPAVLFHHLRLDDVELAGLRPRHRRDAAPLRRLALPSRRQHPVRLCRRRADDVFRHLGEIHRHAAQVGAEADRQPRPLDRAHGFLHRLAAVAGGFCLRL